MVKKGEAEGRAREVGKLAHIAIIGSGIAGLFAASKLADAGHRVTVITKKRPKDSSTNWAQGGIAAILDKTNREGMEAHVQDTLRCGDGACDETVVRSIIEEAGERIQDLIQIGVEFEKDGEGSFSLVREGGHSSKRILHAKDATGKEIERALTSNARSHPNNLLKPNTLAIDLIQRNHGHPEEGVAGVWCLDQIAQSVITFEADAVVLATGGVGRLWKETTNPDVATGDGLAMAYRTGACVENMAYIQFHPTALSSPIERPFLISEAVRGAGGVLLDERGIEAWEAAKHRAKEAGESTPHPDAYTFTLDERLEEKFPTIARRLEAEGLTIGRDPIPVVPAAHYMVGGVRVDGIGRAYLRHTQTPMPHLYAIGEVACTGMHGANRLASNSLLEAVVYAQRVASHLIEHPPPTYEGTHPEWRADGLGALSEHAPIIHDRLSLVRTMSQEVGIVRSNQRLKRAKRRLDLLRNEVDMMWKTSLPTREIVELRNLCLIGQLVVEDAVEQTENQGLHYNVDLIRDDKPEPRKPAFD